MAMNLQQGLGPVELRATVGQSWLGPKFGLGVGMPLAQRGAWSWIGDVGVSTQRYSNSFEVPYSAEPADTAAGEFPEEEREFFDNPSLDQRRVGVHDYSYRVLTPSLRVRSVYTASERWKVPVALRYSYSSTALEEGLFDWEREDQHYVELTAGALFDVPKSCLQLGAGATVVPVGAKVLMVGGSVSCRADWTGR
jgi:hypothetical protein